MTPRRLIFDLILIVLCLATLEFGSSLLLRGKRLTVELMFANDTMLRRDEELGWTLNPKIRQRVQFNDRIILYESNSMGFRGKEPRLPIDVIFAGDSFTFGMNSNTSFPEEFSNLTGAQVINTAVVGYGTDQAFLAMKRAADLMQVPPKWIVYGFYKNDLLDNVSDRNRYTPKGVTMHKPVLDPQTHGYIPPDAEQNDVTAQLREPRMRDMAFGLMMHSQFLWAVERIREHFVDQSASIQITDSAREYLEGNLRNFADYARAKGARFAVVHIPDEDGYMEDDLATLLQTFCKSSNATYIRPTMKDSDYLPIDGHLSDAGAHQIAWALAAKLPLN